MLALFYGYLATLIGKAIAIALVMNGITNLVGRYLQQPIEVPKKVVFWASLLIVFLAGFEAWREEHNALTDARDEIANLKTGSNHHEVTELGRKLAALEAKNRPRHLTQQQMEALLTAHPPVTATRCEVTVVFADTPGTGTYATEITDTIGKAGWPTLLAPFLNRYRHRITDDTHPIMIRAKESDTSPASIEAAFSAPAFTSAGIEVQRRNGTDLRDCTFEVQVGDIG